MDNWYPRFLKRVNFGKVFKTWARNLVGGQIIPSPFGMTAKSSNGEQGWSKNFESGSITRTWRSQNGWITIGQIRRRGRFWALGRHYTPNLTIYNNYFWNFDIFEKFSRKWFFFEIWTSKIPKKITFYCIFAHFFRSFESRALEMVSIRDLE